MLLYISGPYSGPSQDQNIAHAADVAARLWDAGHHVICPHANTANFEDRCQTTTYADFIAGDLAMLAVCDGIVMLDGWTNSRGANIEHEFAHKNQIAIFSEHEEIPLHPTEVDCPNQAREFRILLGRMYRTHLRKNKDYSPANVLLTGSVGNGTRLWDKVARLVNLSGFKLNVQQGEFDLFNALVMSALARIVMLLRGLGFKFKTGTITWRGAIVPDNESVEDTLMDSAVYSLIMFLLRRGHWGN